MWGTDMTQTITIREGTANVFVAGTPTGAGTVVPLFFESRRTRNRHVQALDQRDVLHINGNSSIEASSIEVEVSSQ
jgi:hypothetical protein